MNRTNTVIITAIIVDKMSEGLDEMTNIEMNLQGALKHNNSYKKRLNLIKYYACDDSALYNNIQTGQLITTLSTGTKAVSDFGSITIQENIIVF